MPSLSESRRQVEESLRGEGAGVDHDAVLASLQDEIDKHNGFKDDLKRSMRHSKRDKPERSQHRFSTSTRKFRFKEGVEDPKDGRRHRRRYREDHDDHTRRKRKREQPISTEDDTAHPFPREPANPGGPDPSTDDAAFRDSLFDALADDEGAAYWESVYSQPIHVYARPNVQTEMSDEQYTAYVKTKMWEKKHPEAVLERERSARRRKEEEEEKTRRREEFVRRKEQAAWERAQRGSFRGGSDEEGDDGGRRKRYEYEFAGEKGWDSAAATAASTSRAQREEYAEAWKGYLAAWDKLKHELLSEQKDDEAHLNPAEKPSKRIPWPTLASKPVIKSNIEDFMRHAPAEKERSMMQLLKAERVRWHPDKVQQRFRGEVDEGTMKIVTGVFQVVDGMVEEERKRGG